MIFQKFWPIEQMGQISSTELSVSSQHSAPIQLFFLHHAAVVGALDASKLENESLRMTIIGEATCFSDRNSVKKVSSIPILLF